MNKRKCYFWIKQEVSMTWNWFCFLFWLANGKNPQNKQLLILLYTLSNLSSNSLPPSLHTLSEIHTLPQL